MSNTWFKREGMRQVIFRLGENETEVDFVLIKKRTPAVFIKCEGNSWGASTCVNGRRYRQEESKGCSEKDILTEER